MVPERVKRLDGSTDPPWTTRTAGVRIAVLVRRWSTSSRESRPTRSAGSVRCRWMRDAQTFARKVWASPLSRVRASNEPSGVGAVGVAGVTVGGVGRVAVGAVRVATVRTVGVAAVGAVRVRAGRRAGVVDRLDVLVLQRAVGKGGHTSSSRQGTRTRAGRLPSTQPEVPNTDSAPPRTGSAAEAAMTNRCHMTLVPY